MAMWDIEGVLDDLVTDIQDTLWGILESLGSLTTEMLSAIPVPEFLQGLPVMVASVPPDVVYWVEPFQLDYGLGVISAAITARILLGLIPYVGGAFR